MGSGGFREAGRVGETYEAHRSTDQDDEVVVRDLRGRGQEVVGDGEVEDREGGDERRGINEWHFGGREGSEDYG